MTIARRLLVDRSAPGWYHCTSRCVRRAFLCGGEFEHRREWVRSRLMELTAVFAVDVAAYAVMSNHLHVVLHTASTRAEGWSCEQVARRWLRLFPGRRDPSRDAPRDDEVRQLALDRARIETLRARLSDLSWFMRCLSEPIARRANREDHCTGRFWEGRFKCRRLLDEQARLMCCVYTDLNPIRADMATTPERSDYTSVQDRIHVRQRYERISGRRERAPRRAADLVPHLEDNQMPRDAEDGIWLMPMAGDGASDDATYREGLGITLDQYLTLVDATGRAMRLGKAGSIPGSLAPILDRLEIDADAWIGSMTGTPARFGTAVGSATRLAREAVRRGGRWVVQVCDIYRPARNQPAPA